LALVCAIPTNLLLFEKRINVIDEYATQAKLWFNTKSDDSAEAVRLER